MWFPKRILNFYFHGFRREKRIALSFDDAPSENTLALLKVLKKYNVKATFFVCGSRVKGREKIFNRIISDGHEIGNHSFSHNNLRFKSRKFIETEILMTDDVFEKFGIKTNLFRFPFFAFSLSGFFATLKLKKKVVFCDVISNDWKLGRVDEIVSRVFRKVKNGSIINLHDYLVGIGENTKVNEVTEKIISGLRKKGFEFVKVGEIVNS